jgi:predicted transcriptional regulator
MLAKELKTAGITQRELADLLGVTCASVSRKLSGHRRWTVEEAVRLMPYLRGRGLDVQLEDLLPREAA